jgi:hypothetical protein
MKRLRGIYQYEKLTGDECHTTYIPFPNLSFGKSFRGGAKVSTAIALAETPAHAIPSIHPAHGMTVEIMPCKAFSKRLYR